jgi:hypothetical protein
MFRGLKTFPSCELHDYLYQPSIVSSLDPIHESIHSLAFSLAPFQCFHKKNVLTFLFKKAHRDHGSIAEASELL